jgi:DNA invertase Pin-like site-specific DNA recombinase
MVKWSEDIQREQIEEWAARKGHEILGWYTDRGVSGGDRARAARDAMLSQAKSLGAEGFVSADLSRWTREDAIDAFSLLGHLRDAGLGVFWVAEEWLDLDAPYALMALVAMISANAEEKKRIQRKTRQGVLKARDSGIWVGRIPWGWERARELRRDDDGVRKPGADYWIKVVKPREITRLYQLRAQEKSWHSIERETNVDQETVRSIIKNRVNRSVVGEDLWDRAQHSSVAVRADSRGYLLTGLLICPWCGNRLIGCARRPWSGGSKRLPTYRCATWKRAQPHPWRSISELKVWRHVAPVLEAFTIGPQEQARLLAGSRQDDKEIGRRNRERSRVLADIEVRRKRIETGVIDGVMRTETARERLKELDDREAAIPPPAVDSSSAPGDIRLLADLRTMIAALEWPRDREGILIANQLLRETIQRVEWPDHRIKYRPRIVLQPRYAGLYALLGSPRLRPLSGGRAAQGNMSLGGEVASLGDETSVPLAQIHEQT